MFDPLRTRKNNKKYYTRKGQIIQAKRTNKSDNVVIEPMLVDKYKKYILDNNLIPKPPVPPPARIIPKIIGIFNAFSNQEALFTDSQIPWTHPLPSTMIQVDANRIFYIIGVSETEVYIHIGSTDADASWATEIPRGFGVKTYVVFQVPNTAFRPTHLEKLGLLIQYPNSSETIRAIAGYPEVNASAGGGGDDTDYSLVIKRDTIDILI